MNVYIYTYTHIHILYVFLLLPLSRVIIKNRNRKSLTRLSLSLEVSKMSSVPASFIFYNFFHFVKLEYCLRKLLSFPLFFFFLSPFKTQQLKEV